MSISTGYERAAYAVLRIVSGFMFSCHGAQKILGWFNAPFQPEVGTQMWIGGIIELVAGVLIAVGLLTRPVAFIASGMMAVAYFQFHWKLAFANMAWAPVVNQGELAVLYCFLFLLFAIRGAGPLSIDGRRLGGV